MLTLEQATKDIILNNGLHVIPISVFSCNWRQLNQIFKNTVKRFQRFRPVIKEEVMPCNNITGTIIPTALQVKSVSFYSGNMIPSQCVPLNSDEYDFDPQTKKLLAIGASNFLVRYCAEYTFEKVSIKEDTYYTLEDETDIEIELQSVPDLQTMSVEFGSFPFTAVKRSGDMIMFEGDAGKAVLMLNTLKMKFNIEMPEESEINISYKTQYEAVKELEVGDDFFYTWFGSEVLKSIGGIKLVTRFEDLPADVSADDLLGYGRELAQQVIDYQDRKSAWWHWLPS